MTLRLAAISDEFSPDPTVAFPAMAALGMRGAELRVIDGRNIIDMSDDEVDRVRGLAQAHGIQILGIASPVLKCELPSGGETDPRRSDGDRQDDQHGERAAGPEPERLAGGRRRARGRSASR